MVGGTDLGHVRIANEIIDAGLLEAAAGYVTITTESCRNGRATKCRTNFSAYIRHVTVFS